MPLQTTSNPGDIVLNERSQVQYLLGNPPSWMMRYGISAIALFFLLMLAFAYVIRYPDVVESKVVLTTTHPPIRVLARTSGRITELLVQEKQLVQQGQVVAVIENTDNREDVIRLEKWLETAGLDQTVFPPDVQLGSLQPAYSAFCQHWKDYHYFSSNPGTAEKIAGIYQQIDRLQEINNNLLHQNRILEQEFVLATKEYERQTQLYKDKVISALDLEKSESGWLRQKRQIAAAESAVLQNQLQIRQLEAASKDLRQIKSDNRNEKQLTLAEDMQQLRSAIAAWKQTFLLTAPIAGRVSFQRIWSTQQAIGTGEEVFAVVPDINAASTGESAASIIGRVTVSGLDFGKIQPGMRALVRLDGFPAQQYGALEGTVTHLSSLPQKEEYIVEVSLPDTLHTTYGKQVPFRQEMSGIARIVTEDRRVIERIFDRLHDLVQN